MIRTVIDLPEPLHRRLDEEARLRGESMGDYVRGLLERQTDGAVRDELFDDALRFDHAPPDVAANVDAYLDDPS